MPLSAPPRGTGERGARGGRARGGGACSHRLPGRLGSQGQPALYGNQKAKSTASRHRPMNRGPVCLGNLLGRRLTQTSAHCPRPSCPLRALRLQRREQPQQDPILGSWLPTVSAQPTRNAIGCHLRHWDTPQALRLKPEICKRPETQSQAQHGVGGAGWAEWLWHTAGTGTGRGPPSVASWRVRAPLRGAPPGPGQGCGGRTPGAAGPWEVGKPKERPHRQGQSGSWASGAQMRGRWGGKGLGEEVQRQGLGTLLFCCPKEGGVAVGSSASAAVGDPDSETATWQLGAPVSRGDRPPGWGVPGP